MKEVEKQGAMRGHLFVEFEGSPSAFVRKLTCDATPSHTYWMLEKDGSGRGAGFSEACIAPACTGLLTDTNLGEDYSDGLPLPAVGGALGATWLFPDDAATWTHEMGHHRHFEHAASAPGSQYEVLSTPVSERYVTNNELHDSQQNEVTWPPPHVHTDEERWDSDCIMSYNDDDLYFCGKCLLRNRGWKVQGLSYPGTKVVEP